MMGRWLVLAAFVAGCYKPTPPEGVACGDNGACPAHLACDNGICVAHPVDAGDIVIDAHPDADLACTCNGNTLACPAGPTQCAAGCSTTGGPHCLDVVPSNGATALFPSAPITISALATFDTDTGEVTGAVTRAAGEGIVADIGFQREAFQTTTLGVFSFASLSVLQGGVVHLKGSHPAVFLVAHTATIAGRIDGSAGCFGGARACAGPGGGAGAIYTATAGGCGPGRPGVHDAATGADSGGGGGGGGAVGGAGGTETASNVLFPGGAGGIACMSTTLEPLIGGSGGGGGGPGDSTTPTTGGGGGGGFQLTAFETLNVAGSIVMAGAGGDTGPTNANNGGAPGGGGAGGGILLEAPNVTITGILAANGGGGGGASDHLVAGTPGDNGHASAQPAAGGTAATGTGVGGAGGAGTTAAVKGGDSSAVNSGAGGGAVGRTCIRSIAPPSIGGTVSPPAKLAALRTM